MANSDKNIRITTSKNKTTYPNIVFTGSAAGSSVITLEVLDDNTLSFTSNEGQVFSIDSNLSTGTIWAVSDISGVPMLSSSAGGTVGIAVYGGIVGIGQTNPIYKLDLKGSFGLASSNDSLYNFIFSNSAASGSNSLQIRSANSLLLYNSGNTFYTGIKSNAAANVTYTLPTTDGSADTFLKTNGSGVLSWGTPSGGSGGGGTGVGAGGQYEMAYYPATGSSVVGSSTFTNNTATGVVSVTHSTVATDYTNGALKVTGGVGIGGSLYVGGIGASIVGVTFSNSTITRGTWNATVIGTQYGGTGQNFSSSTGLLRYSSGTASVITSSSDLANVIADETGSGSLVFATGPVLVIPNIGAATGTSLYLSATSPSNSSTTGALTVPGGVGIGLSVSIGGRLQLFNGSNYAAFLFSGSANTTYTLPATSPATGSSVLQSDSGGIMSWVPMVASSGGAGSGTVAIPGAQYQIAAYYWSATGASVSGSSTFTNNTATGQVAITHNTASTSTSTGALAVSGGLGLAGNAFIGGTAYIPSTTPSNISNLLVSNSTVSTSTTSGALVVTGGVGIGGSLFTATGSSSSISGVRLANNTVNASTYNKVAITAPTSLATLTLADGSSLITSGANSLTLTTGGTTNATLPTGTVTLVATTVTSLANLTAASSLNSIGTITTGTWSGSTITAFYGGTGLQGPSAIGDIIVANTATTWSRYATSATSGQVLTSNGTGAAPTWQSVPPAAASSVAVTPTVLDQSFFITAVSASNGSALGLSTITSFVVNPSSGIVTVSGLAVTATTQSTSSTTGALRVTNGAAVGQTLSVGGSLNIFNGANYSGFRYTGSNNLTYLLPVAYPSGTGTSYLSSSTTGEMAWVAAPTSGGSGSVNSGTANFAAYYATTSTAISENANLQFTGTGLSVGGNIQSSSTTTGSLQVRGGFAITGNAFIGGTTVIVNNQSSSSTTSGALSVTGGLGLLGNAFIGGTIVQTNTTSSVGTNSGSVTIAGGLGIAGNAFIGGTFVHQSTTSSVGTNSGSVTLAGGIGIAGNAFIGGTFVQQNSTSSFGTNSGAITVAGGVGIAGNAFIGGTTTIQSSQVSTSTTSGALVVTGGVGIGGSLYTSTGSTSSVSGVLLQNGNVSATTYNKLTLTAPATNATLTLSNGSSLITSGGHSLTFTTTNATNVTVPTTGTLATTSNKLSDFAATTSSELLNTITGETGSGALVFGTSPEFTTSITTPSTTFSVFNATATTINAFGAATVLSIGANSGKATFNSADNSTSTTTGAIVATGGAAVGQSLSIGGRLQMFNGANYTAFVSAASGNVTYTLPPTAPSGTGTSYLSASTTGVMAWVAAPTSGGATGTINSSVAGKVAFYSGTTTLSGDSANTFDYSSASGKLLIASEENEGVPTNSTLFLGVGTGTTNFAITGYRKTLAAFITNKTWTDGDLLVLGVAGAATTIRFAVDWRGYTQIGVPGTGFTLPVTNGTSGQVLTANTNGVASWTTVSGSSGAGSGTVAIPGAQYQVAAYYHSATGASVSGSTTFTNNTATGVVDINHTTESTSTTTGALVVDGGAGIAKSLYVGTTLSVGQVPNYNIPNNLASFTSTVNSYNQLVIANKSNGTSASSNLVVNNDQSTDAIYYGEIGMNSSAFSGSGALAAPNAVYVASTTAPLVLGTTTQHPIRFVVNGSATDTIYIHEAGTAISVFTNLDLRAQNDIRFFNATNSNYAALQASNVTNNYTLSLPTAPVGAGASVMVIGSDSNMYFAAPGSGIAFSSATANTPVIRARRSITMQFCAGYTPAASGPDTVILKIPDSSQDGLTDVTYVLREFDIRVETPSSGSSRIQLEKLTSTGAFTLGGTGYSMIGGFGITLTGAGTYFTSTASFAAGALVTSNDKLRVNWTLLNATHANFSIQLTMQEV